MRNTRTIPLKACTLGLVTLAAFGWSTGSAAAQTTYFPNNATIDAAHSVSGDANIGVDGIGHNSSPTVRMVAGGSIVGEALVFNSSTFAMTGGTVSFLDAYDTSTINISGGTDRGALDANDRGNVIVSGGLIDGPLNTYNSSTATVSGGTFTGNLETNDASVVHVSGGTFQQGVAASGSSTVTITGGTFRANDGVNFYDSTTGLLELDGTGLIETFLHTETDGSATFRLAGTLLDGTSVDGAILNISPGARFTFDNTFPAAAPEPSQAAALGIGLLGLFTLALRTRRRSVNCQA